MPLWPPRLSWGQTSGRARRSVSSVLSWPPCSLSVGQESEPFASVLFERCEIYRGCALLSEELAVAHVALAIECAIRHRRANGAVWLVQMGAVGEAALPQIGRELAEAGIELAQGGSAQG